MFKPNSNSLQMIDLQAALSTLTVWEKAACRGGLSSEAQNNREHELFMLTQETYI